MTAPLIYVAGHRGMVGSAIVRALQAQGHPAHRIVTCTHHELDLTDQFAVRSFFAKNTPDQVYLAAAKVGDPLSGSPQPAELIYDNLMLQANVVHAAFRTGVKQLLFLGCRGGHDRLTEEPFAVAKKAGIKICDSYNRQYGQSHGIDYRSLMSCSLYGPGGRSPALMDLMRWLHQAKLAGASEVVLPGSSAPEHEYLYVDDMAKACIQVMGLPKEHYATATSPLRSHMEVGSGTHCTRAELARAVAVAVGYRGAIRFETDVPEGPPPHLTDSHRLRRHGWRPQTDLAHGLVSTYRAFLEQSQ